MWKEDRYGLYRLPRKPIEGGGASIRRGGERYGLPSKMKLTLGLTLALAGSALADTTYSIRSGDTVEVIAKRFGVKEKSILSYNGLQKSTILKIGRKIVVPGATSKRSDAKVAPKVSTGGGYVVRNGDFDWALAKRFGISTEKLRAMNPSVNWRSLQIGQKLNVPGAPKVAVAKKSAAPIAKAGGAYTLQSGDNDWLIARRFSTTPKVIRQLNPDIRWDRAQIGTRVRVPGTVVAKTNAPKKLKARYAVVTGDNVMVREGGSTATDAITKVQAGTKVTVLDNQGEWYKLRFPHGTTGWVRGDFLQAAHAPVQVASAKPAPKVKKSSKKPTRVAKAKVEDEVGYITQEVVALQQKGGSVEKVLSKARSLRGVRYRWGGASRSGTDCSGFTTQTFKTVGIKLPRTSGEQSRVGTPVKRTSLKAGDLVFFRTTRGSRVSHVGIYTGGGKFIHASSGGGKVMESSLSEGYYSNRFVTARRLVKGKTNPKEFAQELPKLPSLGEIADPDPVTQKPAGQ